MVKVQYTADGKKVTKPSDHFQFVLPPPGFNPQNKNNGLSFNEINGEQLDDDELTTKMKCYALWSMDMKYYEVEILAISRKETTPSTKRKQGILESSKFFQKCFDL